MGITNPDPMLTRKGRAGTNRSSTLANPLTYYERYAIIQEVQENARRFSRHDHKPHQQKAARIDPMMRFKLASLLYLAQNIL
jgi:hypothetical protein